jgi:hypothetical protein
MKDMHSSQLSRRRLLVLTSLALAAPALGLHTASAAETNWVQNHQETDLWSKSKGGKVEDRAAQWSYFKLLGKQEDGRFPVEHPLEKKKKVYVDAIAVGLSGPPPENWAFKPVEPPTEQVAEPAPASTPPGPSQAAPASPQPVTAETWVSNFSPTALWSAPKSGLILGEVEPGNFFKVLEPQQGDRLKVLDPLTSGTLYVEAKSVGPVGGPPTAAHVPTRWWGFVGAPDINVRAEPHGNSEKIGTLVKGTPLAVQAWVEGQEVIHDQPGWGKLVDGVFVYGPLLRKAQIETPPPI